ncbi:MAG: glycosyltransferase family 2 protein [Pseudomonadota bacterium]|nr:glycosyltransferase family 2 protein [Pseudomonadota bacterium]
MIAKNNISNSEGITPVVSVVVPVLNEAENVGSLVKEIVGALRGKDAFEMIFVDDGSDDTTSTALACLKSEHSELRVIRHRRRTGQSAAIWTGVVAALAPIIVTLDGDGQNDPANITCLLAQYRVAEDPASLMVTGFRAKRRDSWLKRVSSRLANGVRAWLLGDNTLDTGCGLKVFARETFLALPRFNHMHRFLPALMIREGGRVETMPVNHRPREHGKTKYGVWNRLGVGIADLIGVMWLLRRGLRPEVETEQETDA